MWKKKEMGWKEDEHKEENNKKKVEVRDEDKNK
jgi:hypothetical protein